MGKKYLYHTWNSLDNCFDNCVTNCSVNLKIVFSCCKNKTNGRSFVMVFVVIYFFIPVVKYLIDNGIERQFIEYIFNIVLFLKQRKLQLTSAIYNYLLKINPLINPFARNSTFGWYSTFRKHVIMSTSSTTLKLALILLLQILANATMFLINNLVFSHSLFCY